MPARSTRSFDIYQVADFSLARILGADDAVINTRSIGTVSHMPPEPLIRGELSKAEDVYGFGVILWEMYCGRRPYPGMSHARIIQCISSGKPLEMSCATPLALRALVASSAPRGTQGSGHRDHAAPGIPGGGPAAVVVNGC